TVRPVDRENPRPRPGPIARALYLTGAFPLVPAEIVDHTVRPAVPPAGVTIPYGRYLATIGGCRACHGADLAGTGAPDAPDLTKSRLAAWTEADFFRAIREGRRPDGTVIDPEKMPWVRSSLMTDDEIRAVWMYIRSLPGKATG
ncbi:MAG TPA: cytochrome c, partial [Gemmatimonadales bacterium]|nr:cytochrome c [Gemmatimonadales bacterium]